MPPQAADGERTQTTLAETSRRRQSEAFEGCPLRGDRYVCYSRQEDAKQFAIRCALQRQPRPDPAPAGLRLGLGGARACPWFSNFVGGDGRMHLAPCQAWQPPV